MTGNPSGRRSAAGLVGVVLVAVVWALLAPRERQLGAGIRLVYLHVAATWAGLVALYAAGLVGAFQVLHPREHTPTWLCALGLTGLTFFGVGFVLSLASASLSWGGILWMEPRLLASAGILALGAVVQWTSRSAVSARWAGLPWAVYAAVTGWSLHAARLFFHPDRPIQEATSTAIRLTFYGMFGLALAAEALAGSMIHGVCRRPTSVDRDSDTL